MKTSKVGIVAVAILMVVTGVGFGVAQAEGTYSEQPISSTGDQDGPQAATSPADEMQLNNPVETGSLSDRSTANSSKGEMEGYTEQVWKGDIDGH